MRHGTLVSVPDSQQRDFHTEKERVLGEARAISRLVSPHIVEVQDAFLENNTAYIVMEYLEGKSLQERIVAVGSLPLDDVHRIAIAVCDALTEVHRQGLLHRDIKPANIMLTHNGRVVLVDFGSARTFDSGRTVRHTQIFTPDYAAPEMYSTQARFGPYTDLFCLGGTLFHTLTGRHPPSVMDRLQGGSINLEFPDALQGSLSNAIRQALQIAVEIVRSPLRISNRSVRELRCHGPRYKRLRPHPRRWRGRQSHPSATSCADIRVGSGVWISVPTVEPLPVSETSQLSAYGM